MDLFEKLYDVFILKLEQTVYAVKLSKQAKDLKEVKEAFLALNNEQKCLLLMEILHLFQCNPQLANLTNIGGGKSAGSLKILSDITKQQSVLLINQSITGFYEQVIDLKTI